MYPYSVSLSAPEIVSQNRSVGVPPLAGEAHHLELLVDTIVCWARADRHSPKCQIKQNILEIDLCVPKTLSVLMT